MKNRAYRTPHSTVLSERVLRWWDYPVFIGLTLLNFTAIAFFAFHWLSLKDWHHKPLLIGAVTLIIVWYLSVHQFRWFLILVMRRPKPMPAGTNWKVGVATTFVPGAESLEMLEETLTALVAMEYPHETWVLDEGDNSRVKALCDRLGVYHFSRKRLAQYNTNSGIFKTLSKHGNYNAWLYEIGFARFDIVVAFDPDHVPEKAFLLKVLGYFDDPTIGYVQAAQVYYNQPASFIARGAAEETYAYYSSTQMASFGMGFPIVTGCHNTHRVTALKQVGGFAPHDADDLLITLFYRASGWRGVYLPIVLAEGLTPVDWTGYLTQQFRWARSVVDIKFRQYPKIARNLPFLERMLGFLHGFYYFQGLTALIGVVLIIFMLATGITPQFISYITFSEASILFVVLQVSEFYRQRFFLRKRAEWGLHWRAALLQLAKWPYLVLALFDVLFDRKQPYALTLKVKARNNKQYMIAKPHIFIVAAISIAWITGLLSQHELHPLLHLGAAAIIAVSIGLLWTEFWAFPPPYDKNLQK